MAWDPANRWRPFCSERCRLIDLGAWVSGERAIPGEPAVTDPADEGGVSHPDRPH
jgi:endogenous inhibitor of DNA gyrase (YacG/DUF329 family)